MKKLLSTVLAALCLISISVAAEAAGLSKNLNKDIAIVIVGSADYKTKDFINLTKNLFVPDKNIAIKTGKEVQKKYQSYWLNEKGLIDEGTPTKEDFVKFVNYSGYDKVVYLVIKDSVLESHGRKKGKDRSRISLTVNAFIVNKTGILQATSSTNEEDSKTSELRARRGAFKMCLKEISEEFNPNIK